MAKDKPFNDAFRGLKLEEPPRAAPATPPARAPRAPTTPEPEEDDALFLRAVEGAEPVRQGPARVATKTPPTAASIRVASEDEEALVQLHELIAGVGPFDLVNSDEYLEGAVAGLDARILRKLRRGAYAIEAHLDLHGLRRDEARDALERFIQEARRRGHRCVLVVHGRGLHSKDQLPVLKEGVQTWLSRGKLSRAVLAFTSARPVDGGAGCLYVLLRK